MIGLGRAGQARLRALESDERARLVSAISREPAVGQPSVASVLADTSVDAVIVCTPNLLHAPAARAALGADKHVAVEYPLAQSTEEARALFDLARERERVLHVEHIELLSPAQARLRELARPLGRPRGGSLHTTGSSAGWIGDPLLAGSPALRAVARLHRLVDLFGPGEVRAARLEPRGDPAYRLEVELGFGSGGEVLLIEERGPDLPRSTSWQIRCDRGMLQSPASAPASGLFAQDLACFLERIRSGAAPYVSEDRILHVLGLVDQIDRTL